MSSEGILDGIKKKDCLYSSRISLGHTLMCWPPQGLGELDLFMYLRDDHEERRDHIYCVLDQ